MTNNIMIPHPDLPKTLDDMTVVNELKKYIDDLRDTVKSQIEFIDDFLQYGRLRTLYNREGIKQQTFEIPYEIFAYHYGKEPPYNQPIEDWKEEVEERE